MSGVSSKASGFLVTPAKRQPIGRDVPAEVPVALVYNGVSHVVMLATPADLTDLALGFSMTEGIVADPTELLDIVITQRPEGIEAALTITARRFALMKERRRFLAGRTGCGLCGVESLAALPRSAVVQGPVRPVPASAVRSALKALPNLQPINAVTAAVHAAAWADIDGNIRHVREDVGRHNALDKLIGALIATGTETRAGFALITSRCSYEMVEKASAAGIGVLVAVSAPTSRALEIAEATGICVIAIARDDSMIVFTHPGQLLVGNIP